MNGRVAKVLRRQVYGKENSPRYRQYGAANVRNYRSEIKDLNKKENWLKRGFKVIQDGLKDFLTWQTATFVADPRRRAYKHLKKAYYHG